MKKNDKEKFFKKIIIKSKTNFNFFEELFEVMISKMAFKNSKN